MFPIVEFNDAITIGNASTQNKTLKFYLVFKQYYCTACSLAVLHYNIKCTRTGIEAMQYISEKDNLTKEKNTASL